MRVSIVIPAYNEQSLVAALLAKVCALTMRDGMEKEIVVVDDGSSDNTRSVIEGFLQQHTDCGVRLLVHAKNQGKGAAVRTGMAAATGDIVIIQDADLEYDPEDIHAVIAPVAAGQANVVYGSRILREKSLGRSGCCGFFSGKHPNSYTMAYLGGVMITRWTNFCTGANLTDAPTCYKCFHRRVLADLAFVANDFSWEPEVTVKLLMRGHTIREVPIDYHPRKRQEGKKINWKHGVGALWTISRHALREKFSHRPA